ncbi:MAG: hypothetical protein EXS13_04070 [Planctomycetes bacterium]|nr:hypothetical protein [Planctomycetota bacterium]
MRHLTNEIGCEVVFVWERVGPRWEKVRIVAGSHAGGPFEKELEIELAGTPCYRVYAESSFVRGADI